MITPSVLHALEVQEVPRVERGPKARPAGDQAVPVSNRPEPIRSNSEPSPSLEEVRQEDLRAVGIRRPLLPEDLGPRPASQERRFHGFLRALESLKGGRAPKLDVFE